MYSFWLLQDNGTSSSVTAVDNETAPHLSSYISMSGVSRADQLVSKAHVSVLHMKQREISMFRGSGSSRHATNTTADPPYSISTEDEGNNPLPEDGDNAGTVNEDTNESGGNNNLGGVDAVMQPLHAPPNSATGQATSSSQGEQHYRETPSQPAAVAETDCDAAMAKSNVEPDPANVTTREEHGIQGKSQHAQHGPRTGAKGGHTEEVVKPVEESRECNKQLLFTDVADITDVPATLSTQGGPSDISVAYNVFCVDIDPRDRHE